MMLSALTRRVLALCAACLLAAAAAACGGSSSSPTSPSSTTLGATFSSIQSQIFSPRCFGCHGSARREQNLDLQNNGHANLVNRQSTQVSLLLVSPGNPDQSYLVHKIDGRAGIQGVRMPQLAAALSATEIATIRQWIQNGAPND
jgi:hypothetical protein